MFNLTGCAVSSLVGRLSLVVASDWTSPCGGLSYCRAWALGHMGSVPPWHVRSCWVRDGPASPLAGGFFTSGPPEKLKVCSIEPKKFNVETLRRWQVNKGVKDDDVSATQRRQRTNILDGRKGRYGDFEMGNNIWF